MRKSKAIEYEAYLQQIAELTRKVQVGQSEDTPKSLDTPGKRALYNNLGQNAELALELDAAVKQARPDGWRGVLPRENIIKQAMHRILKDAAKVEDMFFIIREQSRY